jgi:hypothetical protein
MKLNFTNTTVQEIGRRPSVLLLAVLILVNSSITSSLAQKSSQKRITSVQLGELAEGSRVSVFSDSALTDYEAFRRGDRFYVRIPLADFTAAQPNFRGDGFDDIQIQRVGDGILVSFKLQLGASARVDQRSNRIDVIFSAPNRAVRNNSANPSPTRPASNAIPGIVTLQNSGNQQRRGPDAAGPMPPDSPTANRPRVVTQQIKSQMEPASRPSERNKVWENPSRVSVDKAFKTAPSNASSKSVVALSNANEVKPARKSDLPSTFTPSSTPSYPTSTPATQSTPFQPRPIVASSTGQSGWKQRSEVVMRWVSANRVASVVSAFVLVTLLVFAGAMLYRGRRKHVRTKRVKMAGVQPKYSPDSDVAELHSSTNQEFDDMGFDDYLSDVSDSEVTSPSAALNLSQPHHEDSDWSQLIPEPASAKSSMPPVNQSWIPLAPSIPDYARKNDVPEREVFEL